MTSIATEFLSGYGLKSNVMPKASYIRLEAVVTGLLHILAKNGLLHDASESIDTHTQYTYKGISLNDLHSIAKSEELSYLYDNDSAMLLLVELLPSIYSVTGSTTQHMRVILNPETVINILGVKSSSNRSTKTKRLLDRINKYSAGYKVVRDRNDPYNVFHIIKTPTTEVERQSLLETLQNAGLQSLSMLERVL